MKANALHTVMAWRTAAACTSRQGHARAAPRWSSRQWSQLRMVLVWMPGFWVCATGLQPSHAARRIIVKPASLPRDFCQLVVSLLWQQRLRTCCHSSQHAEHCQDLDHVETMHNGRNLSVGLGRNTDLPVTG